MKVLSASAMASLESLAYQQGYQEQDFMERAGAGIALQAQHFIARKKLPKQVLLLCGKGNNGGDAFVAGTYLLDQGYTVAAIQLDPFDRCSHLCYVNGQRFLSKGGVIFSHYEGLFSHYALILDGLFGTGFKGKIGDPYAPLVQAANQSKRPILAIDIPSGLNGSTGQVEGPVIQAEETIFLGLPKAGFFLQSGWNVVGKLRYVDFGLPKALIEEAQADFILLTSEQIALKLPPIKRNRQKYQVGYVLGLAGSPGMPGAALLSSLAALRGGCGIIKLLHPDGMQAELAASPYEIIRVPYRWEDSKRVLELMQKGSATFIGPGLGRSENSRHLLQQVVPFLEKPCVIDADALTLLSQEAFDLPKQAILTPHTGEMQRLFHRSTPLIIDQSTLQDCQKYAEEKQITLILKGAPTFIFHPHQPILVNPTGDPGMATAGSGDVLTGLVASLLSQGLQLRDAASLAVYLHGLAGEYAAQARTSYSMLASDLINCFSEAYRTLALS